MTREDVLKEVLAIPNTNILLELSTGTGKTRLGLELANKQLSTVPENERRLLIVYPKNTLETDWRAEIKKWNMEHLLPYITFTNYASLHKHAAKDGKIINYTVALFDEGHHLSEYKRELIQGYSIKHNYLLSATIGRNLRRDLQASFKDLYIYKLPIKLAIEENILPSPTIVLIPLELKNVQERQVYVVNPKAKKRDNRCFKMTTTNYWQLKKDKTTKYGLCGNALEYNQLQDKLIDFYKRKSISSVIMKNIYIQMCGLRLKWYADIKTPFIKQLHQVLKNRRTITFCTSIEQADNLGKNAIHSKNKNSAQIKEDFNNRKIKHITSVDCLTEGANLTDCQFGIWARYNTSDLKIAQKQGRLLRHKDPYLILPYFKGTKEEDIVKTMCESTGTDKIITTTIDNLKNIIK